MNHPPLRQRSIKFRELINNIQNLMGMTIDKELFNIKTYVYTIVFGNILKGNWENNKKSWSKEFMGLKNYLVSKMLPHSVPSWMFSLAENLASSILQDGAMEWHDYVPTTTHPGYNLTICSRTLCGVPILV